MSDMSSKERQQPELNLSLEANKHLDSSRKAADRGRSLSRFVRENTSLMRRILGQKLLVPALLVMAYAGCNNSEQQNVPTIQTPTHAASEMPGGVPSATTEFTDSRDANQLTPEQREFNAYNRESLIKFQKEIRDTNSRLMDEIEEDGEKTGYYYINIGGEKETEDSRIFLLLSPIRSNNPDINTWVLFTPDGKKSFSVRPDAQEFETDFPIETRGSSFGPSEYILLKVLDARSDAIRSGTKPKLDIDFKLILAKHPSWLSDTVEYTNPYGKKSSIGIDNEPPTNDRIVKLIEDSRFNVNYETKIHSRQLKAQLTEATDLSEEIESIINPQKTPTPTP